MEAWKQLKRAVEAVRQPATIAALIVTYAKGASVDCADTLQRLVADDVVSFDEATRILPALRAERPAETATNADDDCDFQASRGSRNPAGVGAQASRVTGIADPYARAMPGFGAGPSGSRNPAGVGAVRRIGVGADVAGGGWGRMDGGARTQRVSKQEAGAKQAAKASTQKYGWDDPIKREKEAGRYDSMMERVINNDPVAQQWLADLQAENKSFRKRQEAAAAKATAGERKAITKTYTFDVRIVTSSPHDTDNIVHTDKIEVCAALLVTLAPSHPQSFSPSLTSYPHPLPLPLPCTQCRKDIEASDSTLSFESGVAVEALTKGNAVVKGKPMNMRSVLFLGEGARGGLVHVWNSTPAFADTSVAKARLEATQGRDLYAIEPSQEARARRYIINTFYGGVEPTKPGTAKAIARDGDGGGGMGGGGSDSGGGGGGGGAGAAGRRAPNRAPNRRNFFINNMHGSHAQKEAEYLRLGLTVCSASCLELKPQHMLFSSALRLDTAPA